MEYVERGNDKDVDTVGISDRVVNSGIIYTTALKAPRAPKVLS